MTPTRTTLVLVAIAAVGLAIAPSPVFAAEDAPDADKAPGTEAAPSEEAQEPVPASDIGPRPIRCTVSRTCQYPPPETISCTSYFGDCDEGSGGYGWVECDGVRQYCSGPTCDGSGTYCKSNSDCSSPDPCTCGAGICQNWECICPVEPVE